MKLPEELLHDISLFLSKVEELTNSGRKELLMSILQKHVALSESELVLSKYDFDMIVSGAVGSYSREALPKKLSGKELDHKEIVNLLLIESAIGVLNNKGALKRLPKFDRR